MNIIQFAETAVCGHTKLDCICNIHLTCMRPIYTITHADTYVRQRGTTYNVARVLNLRESHRHWNKMNRDDTGARPTL